MRTGLFLIGLGVLISGASGIASQLFYDVPFSSPPHTVNAVPVTGLGSSTPTRIVFGTPKVAASFGSLTNQPLVFSGIGYQQIQFNLGHQASKYFVEFDFE